MKYLFVFILSFHYFFSSAQVEYGYKFGIGSTGVDYGNYNKILGTSNGLGLNAGVFADVEAGDDFYVQFMLQFTKHTASVFYKADPNLNLKEYTITGTEYALNLPMNFLFKFDPIQVGFGPQMNVAFSSANRFYSSVQTNWGLNFLVGYSVGKKSTIQANYSFDFRGNSGIKKTAIYLSLLRNFGKN
jgi:hypothetical protein